MARKIIQISTAYKRGASDRDIPAITAVCDDGTIWTLIQTRQSGWEKVVDIPQDSDNKDRPKRDDVGKF